MDAIEFVDNYKKYVSELSAVVKDRLSPIVEEFKNKNPHDLLTPETWFPNETSARGFLWSLFIDAVNKRSHETITIDIEEINSVEDIEIFFALLYKERILFHPETSLSEIVNTDIYGNITIGTFTQKESERLDRLMEQCYKVAEEENIDIFQTAMRIKKLVWGDPKMRNPNNN